MSSESEELDYEEEEAYGPALPPPPSAAAKPSSQCQPRAPIGPSLPPQPLQIGPALPPGFAPQPASSDESDDEDEAVGVGGRVIGPALPPPGPSQTGSPSDSDSEEDSYGPALPPPDGGGHDSDYAQRLQLLRTKKAIKAHRNRREEWMTEAPSSMASFGMGARSFRRNEPSGERDSSWTHAPEDRLLGSERDKEVAAKEATTAAALSKRDAKLQEQADALSSGRQESLMAGHAKRRGEAEAEAEAGEAKKGRREFDRDKDVLGSVARLDAASVKASVERVARLGSRFGHGAGQKFL